MPELALSFLYERAALRRAFEAESKATLRGARIAVTDQTEATKADFRAEVRRGLGGRKVANTIRSGIFKNSDGTVTGFIYSKFGRKEGGRFRDAFAPHVKGATISSDRAGGALIIPVRGTSRRISAIRRDLARVGSDPKLAIIPQGPGRAIFVRRTSSRRTMLIAILLRKVKIPARLNFERHAERGRREFPDRLVANINREAQRAR